METTAKLQKILDQNNLKLTPFTKFDGSSWKLKLIKFLINLLKIKVFSYIRVDKTLIETPSLIQKKDKKPTKKVKKGTK